MEPERKDKLTPEQNQNWRRILVGMWALIFVESVFWIGINSADQQSIGWPIVFVMVSFISVVVLLAEFIERLKKEAAPKVLGYKE